MSNVNYPLFKNQDVLDMSDNDLMYNINEFQSYIKRERRSGADVRDAEEECAYLLNERDLRNRN